jgi:transcriptional regulator with XRE-family HTH domain
VPADLSSAAYDLANELRERRKAAGFASQDALARVLNCDRTRITKAENGQVPTDDLIDAWAAACNFDPRPWKILARYARERSSERSETPQWAPRWFQPWLEIEPNAALIRVWSPLLVTGLFQPVEYARALFRSGRMDENEAEAALATRLKRQEILDAPRPPTIVALLDETVLYRFVGSPAVMITMLENVLAMSSRWNVTIQVVRGPAALAGMFGGFHLASGPGMADLLMMSAVADQVTDSPELIQKTIADFELIRGRALDAVDSRVVIREATEYWESCLTCASGTPSTAMSAAATTPRLPSGASPAASVSATASTSTSST